MDDFHRTSTKYTLNIYHCDTSASSANDEPTLNTSSRILSAIAIINECTFHSSDFFSPIYIDYKSVDFSTRNNFNATTTTTTTGTYHICTSSVCPDDNLDPGIKPSIESNINPDLHCPNERHTCIAPCSTRNQLSTESNIEPYFGRSNEQRTTASNKLPGSCAI
jgi:hypothetical protein